MAGIYKVILALVVVHVALVLAKPYGFDDDGLILEDGTYHKRASKKAHYQIFTALFSMLTST